MNEILKLLQDNAVAITGIIGAIGVIWRTCGKPIKDIIYKIDRLTDDVARLAGDRLNQSYDFYMKQGWCPGSKKRELMDWHRAYTSAGHNHLADNYIGDLLRLP